MLRAGQPGKARFFFLALFAVTLALRLCHSRILWADEDYHLAAGIQILDGKLLYRDFWYDKPPLAAWISSGLGGVWGWPLRLFDAVFVLAVCIAMYRFGRDVWGKREGFLAAGLLAFFLNFDHASAVIPVAPDFYVVLPHIVAIHCAWRGKPLWAGLWSGIAFLFHTKGVLVLAMCALLSWPGLLPLFLGFAIPNAVVWAALASRGALAGYFEQVWQWGFAYASKSPIEHPVWNALRRTLDWIGFHAVLAIGAAWLWWNGKRGDRWWIGAWTLISVIGVALGAQFRPRYFFEILPPLTLAAARGLSLLLQRFHEQRRAVALATVAAAMLVPLGRFGPRYAILGQDLLLRRPHRWSDVALDQDSQAAAGEVNARKRDSDTLFVWGYRPDIFVYTRLPAASRFWDSQPLTGVPADRHLFDANPILPEWAASNRLEITASRPAFIVDSLSIANPRLAIQRYPELRDWLEHYEVVARTGLSVIYRLRDRPQN